MAEIPHPTSSGRLASDCLHTPVIFADAGGGVGAGGAAALLEVEAAAAAADAEGVGLVAPLAEASRSLAHLIWCDETLHRSSAAADLIRRIRYASHPLPSPQLKSPSQHLQGSMSGAEPDTADSATEFLHADIAFTMEELTGHATEANGASELTNPDPDALNLTGDGVPVLSVDDFMVYESFISEREAQIPLLRPGTPRTYDGNTEGFYIPSNGSGGARVSNGDIPDAAAPDERTSAKCVSANSDVMEAGLRVSDLVWGKVKTYPWWPGQIFDRSDASDLALKHRGKGDVLVAYFGDRSFAWRGKSQLKPFYTNFSQMEKQSSSDAFTNAVEDALEEVSRRVELGLKCSCLPEEDYTAVKYRKVVNAGIREGTDNSAFDKSVAVNFFKPVRILQYIKALGRNATGGLDTLELVIAKAQLKAFYCSKGYPELPEYTFVEVMENDEEISPSSVAKSTDVGTEHSSDLAPGKRSSRRPSKKQKPILEDSEKIPTELCAEHSTLSVELAPPAKQKRGRPPKEHKHIKEVLSPLSAKKSTKRVVDHSRSLPSELAGKRRRRVPTESTDAEQESLSPNMKDKNMELGLVLDTKSPPPTQSSSIKVGEYIQRVASTPWYNSSVDELHSQLCLAASDPLDGHSFLPVLLSFFTVFRNSRASGLPEVSKHSEEMGSHMESFDSESVGFDTSVPDHMKDSYWSDMIISDSAGSGMVSNGLKRKEETDLQRQRKKRKLIRQPSSSCLVGSNINTVQHLQCSTLSPSKDSSASERLIIRVEDKVLDTPTALILNFKSLDNLPSQANLINIFCRYGPLRESETEILRKTKRVKIVFKRRADAEKAFSSAGKYSIFGPALVSYKLKYLPPAPEISSGYSTQGGIDAVPTKEHDTVVDQAGNGVLSGT